MRKRCARLQAEPVCITQFDAHHAHAPRRRAARDCEPSIHKTDHQHQQWKEKDPEKCGERQGQQASVDYLSERILAAFGNDMAKHLTDRVIVTAWEGDPWTLGSYSAALPGSHQQRAVLGQPIENRIFFAGEATSTDFYSTCHGAYLSGIRAIEQVAGTVRSAI